MEFLRNTIESVAHESVTDALLLEKGLKKPDFIPTIMRLFPTEAPLISLLDIKKQKTKDLTYATNNDNYRTVGANHVQYAVETSKVRMDQFTEGPSGKVFVDDFNPDKPGLDGSEVIFWADGNWAGQDEIIELPDGSQMLSLKVPHLETNGSFRYHSRMVGRQNLGEYIDPKNFTKGYKFKAQMNAHPHDYSDRATEKAQFDGWGDAYLTLQRFKYSWSGTAKATKTLSGYWTMHNGQMTFLQKHEAETLRMAAEYLNWQLVFGKCTVSTQDKRVVTLKNDDGRDVLIGDGIMNANGGALKMPINNGWNRMFIETLMADMDPYIRPGIDGTREVAILMTNKNYMSFQGAMKEMGATADKNIEGDGQNKGINDTYSYYELGGIRLIPKRWSALDPSNRPGFPLPDGSMNTDWDAIAVPMGLTNNGNKGLELIQLRPSSKGTVAGIDMGGNISTSVDGSSTHYLFQNGIVSRITPFYIRRESVAA